jgi:hypothetical protein
MKRIAVLILALALSGCASITMTTSCPVTSTGVSFALAGSTVGNTALSMLGQAAAGGMLANKATAPAPTSATMTYNYLPIFGADSGSLNCIQAPANTIVVTSAPASIVH